MFHHLQGLRVFQAKIQHEVSFSCCPLHADFSLGLFPNPEEGSDTFLRNAGWFAKVLNDIILQKIKLFTTAAARTGPSVVYLILCPKYETKYT
jgi:hypothetical protein